ncbi:MAG TPA: dTMP kinase [Deltaproteobacteria bacterium]|nr:dTMP kinase [Deltaproteobacteria bacterium]
MGLFITFEGPEGSGKTTQIKKAGEYLRSRNISCILTEEPGGTELGYTLRQLLLNKSSINIVGKAELLLFAAARAQHVEEVILPALGGGAIVLCDRFADATIAYQGYGRGLNVEEIRWINDYSSRNLKPDRTLFFNLPVETGLNRAMGRIAQSAGSHTEDRFEGEELQFHRRVWEGYYTIIKDEPERFRIINAARDIEQVFNDVCYHLDAVLSIK